MKKQKICTECGRKLVVGDRHNLCTSCRFSKYRESTCACGSKKQKNSKSCIRCHNSSSKKSVIAGKEPKRYKSSQGYITMFVPDHPRNKRHIVQEHILVMEEYLGRYLVAGETVHHINGIRDDNRLENLELWVRPQPSGIRAIDAYKHAKEIINRYDNLYGSNNNQET